jgi:hypothetical protein
MRKLLLHNYLQNRLTSRGQVHWTSNVSLYTVTFVQNIFRSNKYVAN